ncbi:MFS transporter [Thalassotalea euphylliae]|uniref:MFS transporter n=1 Tax=Thalassotalea euphylliae TaxID=1655234 RepID=UPI003633C555
MSTQNKTIISVSEKVGYAFGDVASNFYWRIIDVFLLIFYTDVFGLPAATVGTMFLVTRIIDAVSDPVMGVLSDRTQTRFGKFRPYLLLGIIPLFAAGVLTFTVPDLGDDGKVIWAYCTYIFLMLAYTFINVPYGALLGVITNDPQQRTTLTSFRFIGAFSGGSLVAYFTPELVNYFGAGDDALGWQYTMTLYGFIAAALFAVSFVSTTERILPPANQQTSIKRDLKDLSKNKPWIVLFVLALVIMVTISLRASSGTFYFKYYVQQEDLIGSFTTVYLIALGIGAAITPILTRFFDRKRLLIGLMLIVGVLSAAFYWIPKDQVALMFVLQALIGLALGPKSPLVFSMYADTADYSEYQNGRRATALVFSAAAFAQKLGGAVAGAIIGWLLASMGYVANTEQSAASESGIVWLMTIIPAVFAFISVAVIRYYPLSEDKIADVQEALSSRRRSIEESRESSVQQPGVVSGI